MKTALYVAVVARTYRQAVDDYFEDPENIRKTFRIIRRKLQNAPTVSLRPASSLENQRMKHRFMITIPNQKGAVYLGQVKEVNGRWVCGVLSEK